MTAATLGLLRIVIRSLFILLFCCLASSQGQPSALLFDGLPGMGKELKGTVTSIVQDHQGYVWLGTWSGLIKYDGFNLSKYQQRLDSGGLQSNKIRTIYEDRKQRLWIGTRQGGLYLYDRSKDEFTAFRHRAKDPYSLSSDNVLCLFEDKQNRLWVGTEEGLNYFEEDQQRFHSFRKSEEGLSNDYIWQISEGGDGSLWLATENGLNRLYWPGRSGPPTFFTYSLDGVSLSSKAPSLANYVYTVQPSKANPQLFWVGTKAGLFQVTCSNQNFDQVKVELYAHPQHAPIPISHPFVRAVVEETHRPYLWIGTFSGLNRIDLSQKKVIPVVSYAEDKTGLNNNVVQSLFISQENMLWIGTDDGVNVHSFNPNPFHNLGLNLKEPFPRNPTISSLQFSTKDDALWFATTGGGFCKVDWQTPLEQRVPVQYHLEPQGKEAKENFIEDILVNPKSGIWLATHGSGLIHINKQDLPPGGGRVTQTTHYGTQTELALQKDYIMSLLSDEQGRIWIGYWDGGIQLLDPHNHSTHSFTKLKNDSLDLQAFPNVVMTWVAHPDGPRLWVGTRGSGILVLAFNEDSKELTLIDHFLRNPRQAFSLNNNFITDFLVEGERIWVASENGINYFDRDARKFETFLPPGVLRNEIVQSIHRGADQKLWISTLEGLYSIQETSSQPEVKGYFESDGILHDLLLSNTDASSSDGQLIFASIDGITYFDPKSISSDTAAPKINLIGLRLFNKPVNPNSAAQGRVILSKTLSETPYFELNHDERMISFEFVGIDFHNPEQIRYAYQLEGFDEDWIYTDNKHAIAHYTNLPYREYTFRVRAMNGDGIWSKRPAIVRLKINPPFWRTPLAYAFYALLLLGAGILTRRIVLLRIQLIRRWQAEKVEREKLELISSVKQQFFTNVSHELRTPLTLIISPLEHLIKQNQNQPILQKSLIRIESNAKRLLKMINQLLDMRRVEERRGSLDFQKVDWVEFLREVVLVFSSLAEEREIKLSVQEEFSSLFGWFDREQMEKVFFNLLSNALKFTPAGGEVQLNISAQPDSVELRSITVEISDTGQGIPPEQIDRIFDRFFRGPETPSTEAAFKGSGIGLSLVKSAVEQHGGTVSVTSELSKGSTFSLTIPLEPSRKTETHSTSELASQSNNWKEEIPNGLQVQAHATLTTQTHKLRDEDGSEFPVILIVEDNPEIRQYLSESLRGEYRLLEAENGQIGWELATDQTPDLVISDIAMPVLDGIQLSKKLKGDIRTSHIPIILLTARNSEAYQRQGFETGADAYLVKPFNLDLLKIQIQNLIRLRQELRSRWAKNIELSPSQVQVESLDEKFLREILQIVEDNMDNFELSVEQVSREIGVSRMQLYRKLKALTGKSPNQLIRSIRLKRAAQLLSTQQYNVSEVTYMVGFQDLKYFRERFKEEFGTIPSEYKPSQQPHSEA